MQRSKQYVLNLKRTKLKDSYLQIVRLITHYLILGLIPLPLQSFSLFFSAPAGQSVDMHICFYSNLSATWVDKDKEERERSEGGEERGE